MGKPTGPNDFKWVRSIFGKGPDAQKRYKHIPDGGMNQVIKDWNNKQPDKWSPNATPSRLLDCPRAIWLEKHGVPKTNEMTWALKQRMLLGRLFENQFAEELHDEGLLLYHWKDDTDAESERFKRGNGEQLLDGVPDYLIRLAVKDEDTREGIVAVSDAKTSRSDSFGYIPIDAPEIWEAFNYYKYRIQVVAYYLLCHANAWWFEERNLPLPTHCHLFTYALDDGLVRREFMWQPTAEDIATVRDMTVRYNRALEATEMPDCVCHDSPEQFMVKFCKYGVVEPNQKVADSCCDAKLREMVPA